MSQRKIGPFPSAYKQHGGEDAWVRPDGRHPDFIIRDFFKGSEWEERIEEMIQEALNRKPERDFRGHRWCPRCQERTILDESQKFCPDCREGR